VPAREPIRNGLATHVTVLVTIPFIDVAFEATIGTGIIGLVYSVIIG
jgi:deoxyinosine 3'endonuclease (endonuclease V)